MNMRNSTRWKKARGYDIHKISVYSTGEIENCI